MADSQGAVAPSQDGGAQLFAYHRQLAPIFWAFTAIVVIEMGVVHLLLARWSGAAALALGVLSGATLLSLVALILSFRRRPVVLGPEGLRVRAGFLVDAHVPMDEIAFAQSAFAPADYMPGGMFKASLLNSPNVVVLLRRDVKLPGPFGQACSVHAVGLALDEPGRFLAAIAAAIKTDAADRSVLAAA